MKWERVKRLHEEVDISWLDEGEKERLLKLAILYHSAQAITKVNRKHHDNSLKGDPKVLSGARGRLSSVISLEHQMAKMWFSSFNSYLDDFMEQTLNVYDKRQPDET